MKSTVRNIFAATGFAVILAFVPVLAVVAQNDADQPTSSETEEPTNQTTSVEEENPEETEDKKQARRDRIEARKQAIQARVSFARQQRLKARCGQAQGKLKSISGRINGLQTSRTQVHQNLLNRLNNLSERLQTHSVDTTELDAQITELQTLIEAFNTNLTTYQSAVNDMAEMDCEADPEGFQASLEAARTERADTAAAAAAVRAYLSETIKPTLQQLKSEFAQNADDQNAETTEQEEQADDEAQAGEES